MGISFVCFNRREFQNGLSLANFDRKEIAHLEAFKSLHDSRVAIL